MPLVKVKNAKGATLDKHSGSMRESWSYGHWWGHAGEKVAPTEGWGWDSGKKLPIAETSEEYPKREWWIRSWMGKLGDDW